VVFVQGIQRNLGESGKIIRAWQSNACVVFPPIPRRAMTMKPDHKHGGRCARCEISEVRRQLRMQEAETTVIEAGVVDLDLKTNAKEEARDREASLVMEIVHNQG